MAHLALGTWHSLTPDLVLCAELTYVYGDQLNEQGGDGGAGSGVARKDEHEEVKGSYRCTRWCIALCSNSLCSYSYAVVLLCVAVPCRQARCLRVRLSEGGNWRHQQLFVIVWFCCFV